MKTVSRVGIVLLGLTGLATAQPKDAAKEAAKPAEGKKPPAELTEASKAAGTWKCKGQGMQEATMKMSDMAGTMTVKVALNGWWVHSAFEASMGKEKFLLESYSTFDPATKKWKRVSVESGGGWSHGESAGPKAGKTDWELTSYSPMGEVKFRDHEDASDPKAGVKMWGEVSPDKGTQWFKVYEMTCKK